MNTLFLISGSSLFTVFFAAIALVGAINLPLYSRGVYTYRKRIPYAYFLLTKGVTLKIRDYSDGRGREIHVCNEVFTGFLVSWNLQRDISKLNDSDFEFITSYYDEAGNIIPVTQIFEKIEVYNKKILPWFNENQGRHSVYKRPQAPYCYIEKSLHVKS